MGLARLAISLPGGAPGRLMAGATLVVLLAIGIPAWPPAVSPDGGWPLADSAAARVIDQTANEPFVLEGIPSLKNDNAMRFPLERRGAHVLDAETPPTAAGISTIVVVCDPLFDEVTGQHCGGAAEDAWMAESGRDDLRLVDRFESGPRRVLSVYTGSTP